MALKAVLFDLDGTLLPMDQDVFIKGYLSELARKMAVRGYEPGKLIDSIWESVGAMVSNDGQTRNEEVFWKRFAAIHGEQSLKDIPVFEDFYRNEFNHAQKCCGYNEAANRAVQSIKKMGYRLVLATNPLFPAIATEARMRWAGIKKEDFELYTTYENSGYCKPNPAYYKDIQERLNVNADECLMIGNDAGEDLVAREVGMHVFLHTDCLINKKNIDISQIPQGGFPQMLNYITQFC